MTTKFQEIYEREGLKTIETVCVDCVDFRFHWLQRVKSLTTLSIATVNLDVAALDSSLNGLDLQVLVLEFKDKPRVYRG